MEISLLKFFCKTDLLIGADSAGVGIRYASAVRFQNILRNTYAVEPGSFAAAPARVPSGNLFAKVTVQPAVNSAFISFLADRNRTFRPSSSHVILAL